MESSERKAFSLYRHTAGKDHPDLIYFRGLTPSSGSLFAAVASLRMSSQRRSRLDCGLDRTALLTQSSSQSRIRFEANRVLFSRCPVRRIRYPPLTQGQEQEDQTKRVHFSTRSAIAEHRFRICHSRLRP